MTDSSAVGAKNSTDRFGGDRQLRECLRDGQHHRHSGRVVERTVDDLIPREGGVPANESQCALYMTNSSRRAGSLPLSSATTFCDATFRMRLVTVEAGGRPERDWR